MTKRVPSFLIILLSAVLYVQNMCTAAFDQFHIVRDDQYGKILHKRAQQFRRTFHAPEIQSACRFIKYKQFFPCEKCRSDRSTLLLTARQ